MEIFKDVVGYEGYYIVSNKGIVKSLGRTRKKLDGTLTTTYPPRIMKQISSGRYMTVNLCVNNKRSTKLVHRLVAMAFFGSNDGLTVNHIDGDRLNNKLDNLEFITLQENIDHAFRLGLRASIGAKNPNSKISEQVAKLIIASIKNKVKPNEIMQSFGVTQNILYKIKNKRTWKHLWV